MRGVGRLRVPPSPGRSIGDSSGRRVTRSVGLLALLRFLARWAIWSLHRHPRGSSPSPSPKDQDPLHFPGQGGVRASGRLELCTLGDVGGA